MGNPKIDKATREARGTMRPDREYPEDERDESEKKPIRPAALEGHGAKFWYKHINHIWDTGWLRRDNTDFFLSVCKLWGEMKDLEEWLEEHTRFGTEETQFSRKTVERPESKVYTKLQESVFKKAAQMGIILDKPPTGGGKKKKKPDPAKDLGAFMNGPTGIAK